MATAPTVDQSDHWLTARTVLVEADKSGTVADEGLAHTLQPASTVAMVGGGEEGRG